MGQLGYSPSTVDKLPKDNDGFPFQPTPMEVKCLSGLRIKQVGGGDGHTVAIT